MAQKKHLAEFKKLKEKDNTTDYEKFIDSKKHSIGNSGFKTLWIPEMAFDFQQFTIDKALWRGRNANFLDTGLGKTLIELSLAYNVVLKTNKRVLIPTPLAVAFQFLLEAQKIGIDDIEYSKDGKFTKKIVVCNFERLHYFNPNDFDCICLDECFAPDTKVTVLGENNKLQEKHIKELQIGEKVLNCTGFDTVKKVKTKKIEYAVRIEYNGKSVISSGRHPYFTQRGWVAAKELQPDDFIVSTKEAMRILRDRDTYEMENGYQKEILRNILLSEMENETTAILSEFAQSYSSKEKGQIKIGMVQDGCSKIRDRKNQEFESNAELRDKKKSIRKVKVNQTQTFSAWGKWTRNDIATAINEGCIVRELGFGICHIFGEVTKGLSEQLQSRLSSLREKNCNRSRWEFTSFEKRIRQEEGRKTGFFGLESFEILEQTDNRLDRYRDESGSLYFYDLEIERHPSFTINECLVHNSSIMKNFDGKTKDNLTSFAKKIKYRFASTATPSPNDFIELGSTSEYLGHMGYMDMLGKFFKNNQNSVDSKNRNIGEKFYLKPHAENDFFAWVNQWSIMAKMPSDLGFSNERYVLPELIVNKHVVENQSLIDVSGQYQLFTPMAKSMTEVRHEQKQTELQRCEKAVQLAQGKTSVYWCNTNQESSYLKEMDKGAVEIIGSQSIERKEEILLAFSNGEIDRIITKAKITSFGLNWQHCNHSVFFPTWSYEQYYQAIRRFWRFGQKNDVNIDVVVSDGQTRVIEAIEQKTKKAIELHKKLTENVNGVFVDNKKEFSQSIIKPKFL